MKKTCNLFAMALVMLFAMNVSAVQAKTWRINNDPAAKADFLSINDAMASLDVYAGDVLYLDPACRLPGQKITKGVTVIGTGYNLTDSEEAMVSGITISANNIKLTGINIAGSVYWGSSYSNITIERCKVQGISLNSASYNGCKGVNIIGCYVTGEIAGRSCPLVLRNSIVLNYVRDIEGGIISNNVIIHNTGISTSSFVLYSITNSTISNNVIINTTTHTTTSDNAVATYNHNTIGNTAVTDYNSINNNVLSNDAAHTWADFPTNKFIGAKVEDIFVNEGNQEEKYRLKEGSPALGYGTNGVDCGAFDGLYPYVVNGRPQFVPYIYDAQIPNTPTDGKLNITLKIKSQNE